MQHVLYAVNMGRMEGDVVYCSQNAMFVLYQLCVSVRNAVFITLMYVDTKILGAHNIFTFLQYTIVLHDSIY